VACDYLDALDRAAIEKHDGELARLAYEKLSTLPDIRLLGPKGERGGLVSFAFPDVHAHDVVTFADEDGVALRGGHHCNQPLMRKLGLASTTRASFYLYNTPEEIDVLVAAMRRTLKFFRG
jgi:cysteine desulfurase/selenocysteine lyase